MNEIVVMDKFLDDTELEKVSDLLHSKDWHFGHKSLHNDSIETPFWTTNLKDETYLSEYVKGLIEKRFLQKFEVLRLYANGQTFGQDGTYHTDSDSDDNYTFCLYMTDIDPHYIEVAGGHIYFKIPGEKYQICYEPIYNRGIFFPARYEHKATAFSRYIMSLRRCITWKLRKIS